MKLECPECGKVNQDDATFCKHCGSNIGTGEVSATTAPVAPIDEKAPTELETSRDSPRGGGRGKWFVLIIIGVIIIIGTAYFLLRFDSVDEHETHIYDPATAPESLTFEVETTAGSVEIKFTSDTDAPVVHIDHYMKWSGTVTSDPSFETSSKKVKFYGGRVLGEADPEVTVTLRSDVKYTIKVKTSNGAASLDTNIMGVSFDSITFDTSDGAATATLRDATVSGKIKLGVRNGASNFDMTDCTTGNIEATSRSGSSNIAIANCTVNKVTTSSDSGSLRLSLTDSTVGKITTSSDSGSTVLTVTTCLIGNIEATADSGSITIKTRDIMVDSDSTWTCEVDSGALNLDIGQSVAMGGDVTVDADVDDKDLEVDFVGNATHVRAKFSADAAGDLIMTDGAGFESPSSGTMESSNYSDTAIDQFVFNLSTAKGDIEVEAENT